MSSAPYFKLYFSDLAGDTLHLSDAEMGSYVLLIGAMWNAGGSLDLDEETLARIARCSPEKWARRWAKLERFFQIDGASICHKRVTAERAEVKRISEERSAAGKAGAEAKALKRNGLAKANASDTDEQLLPKNASKRQAIPESIASKEDADASSLVADGDDEAKSVRYDPRFQAAWDAYPHVTGRSSRPKAYPLWKRAAKGAGSTRLQAAIERYAREGREPKMDCGAAGFHLWLRDARFEDWLAPDAAAAAAAPPAPTWQGPPHIRAAFVSRCGEGWTKSYIDYARWRDLPTPALIPRNGYAGQRIRNDAEQVLEDLGFEVVEAAAAAA